MDEMNFEAANLPEECIDPSKEVDLEGLIKLISKIQQREKIPVKDQMLDYIMYLVRSQFGGWTAEDAEENWHRWVKLYGNDIQTVVDMINYLCNLVNINCGGETPEDALMNWRYWFVTWGEDVMRFCMQQPKINYNNIFGENNQQ